MIRVDTSTCALQHVQDVCLNFVATAVNLPPALPVQFVFASLVLVVVRLRFLVRPWLLPGCARTC